MDWDPELGHRRGARTPTWVIELDVGPIDKNAQYAILRRLGWVSPPREHFQNFGFIVILYFDAPRGMVSRYLAAGVRPAGRPERSVTSCHADLGAHGGLEHPPG
jgi:hypothetical protein